MEGYDSGIPYYWIVFILEGQFGHSSLDREGCHCWMWGSYFSTVIFSVSPPRDGYLHTQLDQ
jgi:hypothetical protein